MASPADPPPPDVADRHDEAKTPAPLTLSAAERRAVLPADAEFAAGSAVLDDRALLAGLDGLPVLHILTRIYLTRTFTFLGRTYGVWIILLCIFWLLLLAPTLVFDSQLGTFPAKNGAVGAVAVALFAGACIWLGALSVFQGLHFATAPVASWDSHPFAVLVRWRQLLKAGNEAASVLVRHDPADLLCPCPRPSCSGPLMRSTWVLYLLDPALQWTICIGGHVLAMWTLCVTFATLMWTTWWSIVLFVPYAASVFVYFLPTFLLMPYNTPSARILGLAGRLQHRAIAVLLADMLERHRLAARPGGTPTIPASEEPYVALHLKLKELWPVQLRFVSSGRGQVAVTGSSICIGMLLSAVAGGCVPLWLPVLLSLWFPMFFDSLVAVAALNAQIDHVSALYRQAEGDVLLLRSVAMRAAPGAGASLALHGELLALFAQTEGLRARFLGFVVDAGVVRTFVVTVITLSFGVWSVFRAAGVYFTVEMMCK